MKMRIPEWFKPAAWGAILGAIVVAIIGFSAGWVMTTGAAEEMAEVRAQRAVVESLTPICVAQFRAEPQQVRETQLAALSEESSWQQGDLVAEQGWATLPGMEEPSDEVAEACAERLLEIADA